MIYICSRDVLSATRQSVFSVTTIGSVHASSTDPFSLPMVRLINAACSSASNNALNGPGGHHLLEEL